MSPIDTAAGLAATVPARGALTRRLLPVALVAFLGFLTVGIPLAVLPTQVQHALGFGTVTVGWVVGIQSIATLLTRQYAGGVCDRRGPRTAVLLGLPLASLAGASYLVSAVAPIGPTASLCVLLAGRLLLGVAESLFLTGTMIWNIGRVGVGNAGRVMAWQGIAIYGALGAGSVIGLALLPRFGFAGVAVAAVAVPLAAMGIALVVPGVAPTGGRRMSFTRVLGRIMAPGLVLALAGLPYGAMAAFLTLDYTSHGWSGAGLALAAFAATFIGIRLVLPGLADRLSGAAVASTSLGVAVVGQTLLWWAPGPWTALVGAALTGAGTSLVFPAMGVAAIRRVPPQNRGLATGGYIAFLDIGLGVSGPVTGAVAGIFGYPAVFLAGAAAATLAGIARNQSRPPSGIKKFCFFFKRSAFFFEKKKQKAFIHFASCLL